MSVVINGIYVATNKFKRSDGTFSFCVSVATEHDVFTLFVPSEEIELLDEFKLGDRISIEASPYVSSRGRLAWKNVHIV